MGTKLLFLLGIIAAHGALAAGWVSHEPPIQRESITTCAQAPATTPHFSPPRELFAMVEIPIAQPGEHQP